MKMKKKRKNLEINSKLKKNQLKIKSNKYFLKE